MSIAKKATVKKSKPRRRPAARRPRRGYKKARDVPDMASLSVTSTLVPPAGNPNFLTNNMYNLLNVQLADYDRAVQVASAYQHYRISKISLRFKPTVDTFAQGGPSKNYLFYMIDKSGSIPTNITLEGLKRMGAKARAFDEKQITASWRPSVLADTAVNAAGPASAPNKYMISPWLSTTNAVISPAFVASAVDHLGIYWYVEQAFAGGYGYQCEVEVQFQFKKPIWRATEGAPLAQAARLATVDNSADGIAETHDV